MRPGAFAHILLIALGAMLPRYALAYDRQEAVRYADRYARSHNYPTYWDYSDADKNPSGTQPGDCTNFVSQALRAGGLRFKGMYVPGFDKVWEQGSIMLRIGIDSKGAITQPDDMAKSLPNYHGGQEGQLSRINEMKPGDVFIFKNAAGEFYHAVIVSVSADGEIKVNAHTNDRYQEPIDTYLLAFPDAYLYHVPDSPIIKEIFLRQNGVLRYHARQYPDAQNNPLVSHSEPLGHGEVELTVVFDTSMKPQSVPAVTFGRSPPYDTHGFRDGTWFQTNYPNDSWKATADIIENVEDGEYRLSLLAEAEDREPTGRRWES